MVTTRSFAVLGVLLAAGLAIFGFQIKQAVKKGRDFDRYLIVRGLSEREVKATLAIWPLKYAVMADDLPSLKAKMDECRGVIGDYLKDHSISDSEVSVGLPSISDRAETEREQKNVLALPRYKAVCTLVVRSPKVDLVKQAIQQGDRLLEKGIAIVSSEYGDSPQFHFQDINGIKPSMIQEATANARAAAEKFASDSKARVGAIRKASQGALELNDRDEASPEQKILRVVTTVEFFLD